MGNLKKILSNNRIVYLDEEIFSGAFALEDEISEIEDSEREFPF